MQRASVWLCSILGVSALAVGQDKRPMTLVELLEVPRLTDPQPSPDGSELLFVVAEANWKQNRPVAHIWRIGLDGAGLVQMTNGEDGETSPRWSPRGDRVAFVARRGRARKTQIHIVSNRGGEAAPLSSHETSVSNISWSPDGRYLYFVAADPMTEEARARDEAGDDIYSFENVSQNHLWRVGVTDKTEEQVTTGDDSVHEYSFSRDGRHIVVLRAPGPLQEDSTAGELYHMDLAGGGAVRLTGPTFRQGGAELSPDNSLVLYTAMPGYYSDRLRLVSADGGETRTPLPDFLHQVVDASWSQTGQSIYFLANMGVHTQLFEFGRRTKALEQLTEGKHNLRFWKFSPSANLHIFAIDEPTNPGDVWVLPASDGAEPRRVTRGVPSTRLRGRCEPACVRAPARCPPACPDRYRWKDRLPRGSSIRAAHEFVRRTTGIQLVSAPSLSRRAVSELPGVSMFFESKTSAGWSTFARDSVIVPEPLTRARKPSRSTMSLHCVARSVRTSPTSIVLWAILAARRTTQEILVIPEHERNLKQGRGQTGG